MTGPDGNHTRRFIMPVLDVQPTLLQTLSDQAAQALHGIGRGIEKEGLRVTPDGHIARTPHPAGLGSSLTHRYITTDFSEALLEFHTPVFHEVDAMMACLDEVHRHTAMHLGPERLWCASMPCVLGGDESIPIAQYGRSNLARMKTIYRRGLGLRYGRAMQAIAGIHYNYSLPEAFWPVWRVATGFAGSDGEAASQGYMGAIRNCLRHHALLVYLYGASPAVCRSFDDARRLPLEDFGHNSLYGPHATSLRLSEIGYQNDAQSGLRVSYNDLHDYANALDEAVRTPYAPYEAIGVRDASGAYQQLNANILQVENEFYGWARPKRAIRRGERVTHALRERGVQYMELRSIDLNPFEPLGISAEGVRFLEVFLLWTLLAPSPLFTPTDERCMRENHGRVVLRGRDPALRMACGPDEHAFRDWALPRLEAMRPVAGLLDRAAGGRAYAAALQAQCALVEEPERTPSARILEALQGTDQSFFAFAFAQSTAHTASFAARPLEGARLAHYASATRHSREDQAALEAAADMPFETYLHRYYACEAPGERLFT